LSDAPSAAAAAGIAVKHALHKLYIEASACSVTIISLAAKITPKHEDRMSYEKSGYNYNFGKSGKSLSLNQKVSQNRQA